VIDKIAELKAALGLTVLMAEQNFQQAIRIADRGYVLVHGKIEFAANDVEDLRRSDVVRRLYLGID
jgi:branched-chain amino acid transport system ATP-binding protein